MSERGGLARGSVTGALGRAADAKREGLLVSRVVGHERPDESSSLRQARDLAARRALRQRGASWRPRRTITHLVDTLEEQPQRAEAGGS